MLIARVLQHMQPLFRDIALHPAADRRVKLRNVTNLHTFSLGPAFIRTRDDRSKNVLLALPVYLEKRRNRLTAIDALDRLAEQPGHAQHRQLEARDFY